MPTPVGEQLQKASSRLHKLKFDSVAVIWARAKLDDAYRDEKAIGPAKSRSFFAKLVDPHPATTRLMSIAVVWTSGSYAPLGLAAKFSCIVLQWEGPVASRVPRNYHAWMVHVTEQQSCASPLDLPTSSAFDLGAVELPAQGNADGPDEIPPVARWDWDARRGEQYVGIACPYGWCELYGEIRTTRRGTGARPTMTFRRTEHSWP